MSLTQQLSVAQTSIQARDSTIGTKDRELLACKQNVVTAKSVTTCPTTTCANGTKTVIQVCARVNLLI